MLLNLHSYYSLRFGTFSPAQLVKAMLDLGYDTGVLTDINNSTATLDFIRLCRKAGLNGLAGIEYRNGDKLLYIGIARNPQGFRELNELMTTANRLRKPLPETPPGFEHAFVVYPYGRRQVGQLREHEFVGIRPEELGCIVPEPGSWQDRYVMLAPVSFRPQDYLLHRQLRAIDHNVLISQLQPEQTASAGEVFLPRDSLLEQYRDFPRLRSNTERLLASCSFDFDFGEVKNKKTFTGSCGADRDLLLKYTLEGLERRYGAEDSVARDRALRELEIIGRLGFSSYFLITDDICRYARSRNFHYVGRGSGANSLVAYCLGITEVCPLELNLPFERFLNPKRKTPPDFDIDFSWNERDEVYEYIFGRYKAGHTALMGTVSTFRSRSILRELGKVYGLPKGEIDRLIEEPEHMLNKNEVCNMILSVYRQMADFPNQRSIHASGVLISELPLTQYSALDYPPKGLPTTQLDMYTAEEIGFEKFDILSQRGIGHIRDCRDIIRRNRGEEVDTSRPRRFFRNPRIAAQLRSANTVGCFYIESPGMRQLLGKLQCDNYLTLVAASSIIRPGVASSGMMAEYIRRHRDPSLANYPHPVFGEQLGETYGVMVYQEDVMKIAHYFGGLDLADADVLRRMMSGKFRNREQLAEIGEKFFRNCREKGHEEALAMEVWRQMESFAGYSFNKAHSASFAVESYQSLFLKTYYPLEFMVAVLNNYGGFYTRKVYINEARKAGGRICLPCVNNSEFSTTIYGKDIYLGFDSLLHLEDKLARRISGERREHGPYESLEDFLRRTGAGLEQVIVLIRCGAFRFTGQGKKELLWEAHLLLSGRAHKAPGRMLFGEPVLKPKLPELESSSLEDAYDEIELMGFTVSVPAFDIAKSSFRGDVPARELAGHEGRTLRLVGDLVYDKQLYTRKGQGMKLGTFLDPSGDFFDTVHFPASLKAFPLRGRGLYLLEGKVVLDFGCPSLEVSRCARLPLKPDPRSE